MAPLFCVGCDAKVTIRAQELSILVPDSTGGLSMRVFIICAIVITAAVGVTGCFHHQKAVTQEPLKLG
jgi:hypothetical protein